MKLTYVGFEGCALMMDGVHICLWNCPNQQNNFHTGKYGYQTRGYQVVSDFNSYITHVGQGFPGSFNDIAH